MRDASLREQSEDIVGMLSRLTRRLYALEADDPGMELPVAQIRVCGFLMDGPQTMGAICRALAISNSAMTQIADRLERAQMVERVPEAEDRRCKSLRLTARGVEIMHARREYRVSRVLQALEQLSADDRQSVVVALRSLLQAGTAATSEPQNEHPASNTLVN